MRLYFSSLLIRINTKTVITDISALIQMLSKIFGMLIRVNAASIIAKINDIKRGYNIDFRKETNDDFRPKTTSI